MRRMRKGFTLVELLIVVSILGALSATMMVSVSGSTAKAKAAAIASNVDACKRAALMYYAANIESETALDVPTSTVINAYIKTFGDFSKDGAKIKYTPDDGDTGKGYEKWNITVDFSGDGEAAAIKTALAAIPGYGTYGGIDATATRVKDGAFKVTLYNGAITAVTPTQTQQGNTGG